MNSPVVTSVTELDDNKVKLSVEVDAEIIDEAIADAFRSLAKEVRIPGFRPGKVPRKVLEARIGGDIARDQALREALPEQYARAVIDSDVDAIAAPEIDITSGQDEGAVAFDAVVEVRPEIELIGYQGLEVEVPSPVVSDDEVDEQIDRMRRQFAELETVDRVAADDDHVTIDIEGTLDGEEVPGLTTSDYDYRIGSGAVVAEIDENLRGASAGDILSFDAEHPDPDEEGTLDFKVLVKDVKAEVLPDLDDDFVVKASEFETVAELRDSIVDQVGNMNRSQAQNAVREGLVEQLTGLIEIDPPQAMISQEMQGRLEDMMTRLQAQGMSLDQYLQMTGTESEAFSAELTDTATQAVKVDLALRAIVKGESIEVSGEDWNSEIAEMAERTGQSVEDVVEQLTTGGYDKALRSDLAKQRALDWVISVSTIVGPEGTNIEWDDLQTPDSDEATKEDETESDAADAVAEASDNEENEA
ncbi:MAG: trigger factor [Acidobacteria bacterium]|nr:trigger factor [Acidobacteriota bacterium]